MKKILLLMVAFLILLSSFSFAEDWIQVPMEHPNDSAWYFSPDHTKFSPQGRLETWLKMVYVGTKSIPTLSPGDYTIFQVYVDPAFEKSFTVSEIDYTKGGAVKDTYFGDSWRTLNPGSFFEQSLQAAYKYAKERSQ